MYEATIRQRVQLRLIGDLRSTPVDSMAMEFRVHRICTHRLRRIRRLPALPRFAERSKALPPALRARPMTGGERHRLVQEEKLRVASGSHHGALAPAKFQNASDPPSSLVLADNLALFVV